MNRDAFALMAREEQDHWWFRGRRDFIARAIRTLALPTNASLLDAGCGSGGTMALLRQFGTVAGFEYDAEARERARARGIGRVEAGALPGPLPFEGERFDVIGLFDVLEHLPEPVASLSALATRVAPTGALVLTVPALPWLWGPHDEVHHHHRRYTHRTLRAHLEAAGWRVESLTYMNMLLLPLAIAQRLRERVVGYNAQALSPSPRVNALLWRIWQLERFWIPQRRLPVGLSLLAVARPGAG